MDATARLAEFAHQLTLKDVPQHTIEAAARLALDTVGSALPAWDAPGVQQLRALMADWSKGTSRVWVTGERVSPASATLINSAMSHALEYDDLHCELPMHSGAVVVPAALAVAETDPTITGEEVAAAIIAGTEIICRLARANLSYRGTKGFRGFNPTSIVAGFAAAAVAGRLMRLDAKAIARAMGLSYAQASGNQQCIADGGLVKRMQPGMVAEAGVRAAWLARAGVTGAIDAIEGTNGYFKIYEQGEYDTAALTDGLGRTFEIDRVGFKRYPVCGMAQPGIDALRELQAEHGFHRDDIETIRTCGSKFVVDMVGRPYRPGNNPEVDAQFNLPYCFATVLLTGNIRLVDLRPENTLSAERRAFADTIPVVLDPELRGKWSVRVEIKLRDGRQLARGRDKAAGQSDRPLTVNELLGKFRDCAAAAEPRLSPQAAERLCQLLLDLPRLPTLAALCDTLASNALILS